MAKGMDILIKLSAQIDKALPRNMKELTAETKKLRAEKSKLEKASKSLNKHEAKIAQTTKLYNENKKALQTLQLAKKSGVELSKREEKRLESLTAKNKKLKTQLDQQKSSFDRFNMSLKEQKIPLDTLQAELSETTKKLKELEKAQARIAKQKAFVNKMGETGSKLISSGKDDIKRGMLVGGALTIPIAFAIKDEDAFASVKKVADLEKGPLNVLRQSIRDLTEEIPLATTEMYAISEAALQAGIGGGLGDKDKIKEVMEFTKLTAKAATAMDVSAEESGKWLATWKQNLKLSNKELEELADRMNYLSDSNNAKAEEIATIFNKSFGTGKVVGFKESEIIAFATSIKAAGVETEQAGTHLDLMFKRLSLGTSATKMMDRGFSKLGLNAAQVTKDLQKDASGTALMVLEKIQQLPEHMRMAVANDIFGGDAAKSVAKLVNNTDILKNNLKEMEDVQWMGSIEKEFENRSDTTLNQLKLMKNTALNMLTDIGYELLPLLIDLLKYVKPLIKDLKEWIKANPNFIKQIGKAAGTFAGLNLGLGALKIGFGNILTILALLGKGLIFIAGIIGWPITLAIAAVTALVAAIYYYWDEIKDFFSGVWSWIKGKWSDLTGWFTKKGAELSESMSKSMQTTKDFFGSIGPWIKGKWSDLTGWFTKRGAELSESMTNSFNKIPENFGKILDKLKNIGKDILDWFSGLLGDMWKKAMGWVDDLTGKFKSLPLINKLFDDDVKVANNSNANKSIEYKANPRLRHIGGSHKNGLLNVPFDGYIAELHKGERVLTADENGELYDRLQNAKNNKSNSTTSRKSTNSFVFNPIINITGNADKSVMSDAISALQEQYNDFLRRFEELQERGENDARTEF